MIAETHTTTSKVESESIVCPNCAFEKSHSKYLFTDPIGAYALVRCARCHLSYLNPRPTKSTIGIYYEADRYTPFLSSGPDRSFFSRTYTAVRKYSVRWKRKRIERIKRGNSVLDIGCGTGEFLFEMKSHGWVTKGLEPSMEAAKFARKEYRVDVQSGFIDDPGAAFGTELFDVITLWHVLEHVHRPVEALEKVRERLTDDGLLVIALPNIASLDAGVYKKDWIALDVPRHLLHFTPETLSSVLGKAGMEIVKQHQMPLDTVFNCLMSEKKLMDSAYWFAIPFHIIRMKLLILVSWIVGLNSKRGSSVMYYIRKIKS